MKWILIAILCVMWGSVDSKMMRKPVFSGGISKRKLLQGALSSAAQAGGMYLAYEGAQAAHEAIAGDPDAEWMKRVMEGAAKKKASGSEAWWLSEEWIIIICGFLVMVGLITTPLGIWCVKRKRRVGHEVIDMEMADRDEGAEDNII